jgi:3-deoxy-D-manno-octulosonic-acid transferase
MLRAYLLAVRGLGPLLPGYLRRRLKRGKEDPERWREKLGEASLQRPDGPLIWLHAVGLGEVMALRGLIAAVGQVRPDLSFLVTSSARSSALAFAGNTPPRTQHSSCRWMRRGQWRGF